MAIKDLFSSHAREYREFRPSYPSTLFSYLSSLVDEHHRAWDAATGNGQAACALVPYFDSVVATDMSKEQIDNAFHHDKITYYVATAEDSLLDPLSIDLITVAQAFHWLDRDAFVREIKRVAKKGCVVAIWCYSLAKVDVVVDNIVWHLYRDILGAYWDEERRLVENEYVDVDFPFDVLESKTFPMTAMWSLEHFTNYLRTWSALKKFISQNGVDPVTNISDDLARAWGYNAQREIAWRVSPKIWRV